jgi:hypothetical protein
VKSKNIKYNTKCPYHVYDALGFVEYLNSKMDKHNVIKVPSTNENLINIHDLSNVRIVTHENIVHVLQNGNVGGSSRSLVKVLGRLRKVVKVNKKQMISYKGNLIGLAEARKLEAAQRRKASCMKA